MANFIKPSSVSFMNMKTDINEYVSSLDNYEQIKDLFPGSNLTTIVELLAGFGTFMNYKYQVLREETYLSKAQLPSSVYAIANTFGYTINRKTAPIISVIYNETFTKVLKSGDILGSYGDIDIVYFGDNKSIEKGDTLNLYIGSYSRKDIQARFVNNELILTVSPEVYSSIDNLAITLRLGNNKFNLSKDIEDYLIFNSVIDYSININSLKLFVSNRESRYGTQVVTEDDTLYLDYIETNGKIDIITKDIKLEEGFTFNQIAHLGTDGDTIERIKKYAPLLYSTMRRMVTNKDHEYMIGAHPLIKSVTADRDIGSPFSGYLTLDSVTSGQTYNLSIDDVVLSVTATSNIISDLLNLFNTKIIDSHLYIKTNIVDNKLYLTGYDGRDTYKITTDMTFKLLNVNEKPLSCTLFINYIKYNVTNEPISLTNEEGSILKDYVERYKLSGIRIIFIRASKISLNFNINMSLYDNSNIEYVTNKINEILANYELSLGINFLYGKVLAEIANITKNNEILIDYILPNQETFNFTKEDTKSSYLKFDDISINII